MADGQVIYEICGDTTPLDHDLDQAEEKARKRSAAWGKIGKAAAAAFTASTSAVIAFGKASVEAGKEFDTAMSQVAATLELTVDEIGELRQAALDAGSTTVFTATQAAEALNYMAQAGYDAETSVAQLPNVLNLAAAGAIDLAYASDMITDTQSALGLSIEETNILVDQMARGASKSNASVQQLGEAILTVGGTAKYMKGGTEEITKVLGVLADNGIKGSEAGTHLRNMLLSLSSPTDDARATLEKLGIEIFDAKGNMRGFAEIFPEMNAAMSELTDQQKLDAFAAMFNTRDIASATALLNTTTERWEELGAAIMDSAGAAEQMAATQLDNLAGDITLFQSALEGAQIRISDALQPTLRQFVQFGSEAIGQLTEAFEEDGLIGALGALGGVLSDAIAYIADCAPLMLEAGIALLGSLAEGIIENMPAILDAALFTILSLAEGLTDSLPELIPTIIDIVLHITETLIENADLLASASIELIGALALGLIRSLPVLLSKGPEIVIKLVGAILSCLGEMLTVGAKLIGSVEDGLTGGLGSIRQIGRSIIDGIWSGISSGWSWLTNKVRSVANSLFSTAKRALGIASPSKKFRELGVYTTEGMALGIQDEQPAAEKAAREMAVSVLRSASMTADVGVDTSGVDAALSGLVGATATITTNMAPIIIYSIMTGSIDVDGFQLARITLQNIDEAAAHTLQG